MKLSSAKRHTRWENEPTTKFCQKTSRRGEEEEEEEVGTSIAAGLLLATDVLENGRYGSVYFLEVSTANYPLLTVIACFLECHSVKRRPAQLLRLEMTCPRVAGLKNPFRVFLVFKVN